MIDTGEFVAAVRKVTGPGNISLHPPKITDAVISAAQDCVKNDLVGYSFVMRFEALLADICGVPHCVATTNGTAALHLALMAVGVNPGDEVIVPSLTFVATANAVKYCGATPRFIDSCEHHLGMHPRKLALALERDYRRDGAHLFAKDTGKRLGAVLMVHMLGIPAEAARVHEITDGHGVPLVEDAAQALGSLEFGQHCGAVGDVGIFSFNGNKIVTTGGGGAVVTKNDHLAAYMRHIATTAKLPHRWAYFHDTVGFNYRLPNINAAVGVPQLERLMDTVTAKRALGRAYMTALGGIKGMRCLAEEHRWRWNGWLNAVQMFDAADRDRGLEALHADGILARAMFMPMSFLPMYRDCPRDDLTMAAYLADRIICLPSGMNIAERF